MSSREADLEREIHRLRCELRRVADEADDAHERARVLARVIVRQDKQIRERDKEIRAFKRAVEFLA